MSFRIPSHNNSANERGERRANWKADARGSQTVIGEMREIARNIVAENGVEADGANFRVGFMESFAKIVTPSAAGPICECRDFQKYRTCAHKMAVEIFVAAVEFAKELNRQTKLRTARAAMGRVINFTNLVIQNKPFIAKLNYVNRSGLRFEKSARFSTEKTAIQWLKAEAFNKFMPTGTVTDASGSTVFEICDAYFERHSEAA